MSKIVFLDIDGTLVDFGKTVSERTKEALLLAKAAGHTLMLCTGRTRCQIFNELLQDNLIDGMIASAGAYIEYKGKELYHRIIDTEALSGLIERLQANEIPVMLMGKESLYGTEKDLCRIKEAFERQIPGASEHMQENLGVIKVMRDFHVLPAVEKLMFEDSPLSLDRIRELSGRAFDVIPSSFQRKEGCGGEISIHGVTKALGISYLLEHLGVDKKDSIAFGDSYNDLEMLAYVDTGVAMGNAPEEIKKAADFVTDAVSQDGLYNGFQRLGLF